METNFFPRPNEVLALPTQIHLAVEDVKANILRHNFKFKPSYQTGRYFQELKVMLDESGWSLSTDMETNWIIQPKGIAA
jgi:hypothetical protein